MSASSQLHHLKHNKEGTFALVEIELNGSIRFEHLLDTITAHYNLPYKIVKAEIAYQGKANYGTLVLLLKGTKQETDITFQYLKTNNIRNTIIGYAS